MRECISGNIAIAGGITAYEATVRRVNDEDFDKFMSDEWRSHRETMEEYESGKNYDSPDEFYGHGAYDNESYYYEDIEDKQKFEEEWKQVAAEHFIWDGIDEEVDASYYEALEKIAADYHEHKNERMYLDSWESVTNEYRRWQRNRIRRFGWREENTGY
jgi:hypothetical protein